MACRADHKSMICVSLRMLRMDMKEELSLLLGSLQGGGLVSGNEKKCPFI